MRIVHRAFVLCALLSSTVCAQATFECYLTGRFPLAGPPNCEGLLCNNLATTGLTGISNNAACGMPTEGSQYARIECFGPFSVPPGGPVTYPLPNNVTELRIPIPPGSTTVSFCWDFYNAEQFASTSFNDGLSISVLTAVGALVQNLVYADVNTLPGSCADGFGFFAYEVGQTGPQGFSSALPALTGGEYLSVACWNGGDNAVPGHAKIDDVKFTGAAPSCPFPPPPPSNDDCSTAIALTIGNNGPFSNVSSTTGPVTASCAFGADLADVWFSFVPPCSGTYDIDTCGAAFNTVLSVYDTCIGGVELACNDDDFTGGCFNFTDSKVQLPVTAGTPYFIRVAGNTFFGGVTGTFNLRVATQMSFNLTTSTFGTLGYTISGGPPAGLFFVAITANAGNFPNGLFYGIDIPLADLAFQFLFGYPFAGPFGPCGDTSFGPIGGLPSGITVYGTALGFPGPFFGIPSSIAIAPSSVVIP
jgi:hypothetical protein